MSSIVEVFSQFSHVENSKIFFISEENRLLRWFCSSYDFLIVFQRIVENILLFYILVMMFVIVIF